jgi:predicted Zn-dependent protease
MQSYFNDLADFLTSKLQGGEIYTASFSGEDSDFARLNLSKVRQAGRVQQRYLSIDLIDGNRHAGGSLTLTGEREEDERRLTELLSDLRGKIPSLPEDPHLLYATEVRSTEQHGTNELPPADQAVHEILAAGEGKDMVGIFASGGIHAGFANSLGQRNWFSSYSFNVDWSFYLSGDKAVKTAYAGFVWDPEAFGRKVALAGQQLEVLGRESKTIEPGEYRVYLAPVALYDYVGLLGWGGYGLKMHKTKQTVLLKMVEEGATLHPAITVAENTRDGVAPNFQSKGFLKPDQVVLIEGGEFRSCLVSPRSAKEYGAETNGAAEWEAPESLDIAPGDIPEEEVLGLLGTGLYVNNVHYLNYSDRPGCRITGLTRFACFWVENGAIVAPINVMRFDETIYRALGENLMGLTGEREVILDSVTYGGRATSSGRVPGALIEGFRFNL